MAGEAQDRGEVIEYLREATLRGVLEGDALPMLEGVLTWATSRCATSWCRARR